MSFDLQLKGLRALVSGGTKGVGAAVVEGLRAAGVQVMATARSAPVQSTMDVIYVAADLSTADGAATVARSVLCLLYTSPSPRDRQKSRMPSSA